jgi:hypothetical protein
MQAGSLRSQMQAGSPRSQMQAGSLRSQADAAWTRAPAQRDKPELRDPACRVAGAPNAGLSVVPVQRLPFLDRLASLGCGKPSKWMLKVNNEIGSAEHSGRWFAANASNATVSEARVRGASPGCSPNGRLASPRAGGYSAIERPR